MRLRQTLQRQRADLGTGRPTRRVDCLCTRGRAGEFHLHLGQADHADLCGAGHLVWRCVDIRRRPPHARCLRARRNHDFVCCQGRFQENSCIACGVVRSHAAPACPAHPPALRPGGRPQHPAAARASGQTAAALGAQLRRAVFKPCHRGAHWPAPGAGRAGPTAGCIAPARQPGTQVDGARRSHPHRARWLDCAQPRSADAHH